MSNRKMLVIGGGLLCLAAVALAVAALPDPQPIALLGHSPDLFTAMAIVTKYAKSHKSPALLANPEAAFAEGMVRCISTGAIAVANGDSANSVIYLGKIPSNAVPIFGLSTLRHDALTGVSDFDIGLYKDDVLVDIDILADGLTLATAGVKDPFAAIAVVDDGKRVWELLGLATDPGCEYQIVATLKAAATAAGNLSAQIFYAKK